MAVLKYFLILALVLSLVFSSCVPNPSNLSSDNLESSQQKSNTPQPSQSSTPSPKQLLTSTLTATNRATSTFSPTVFLPTMDSNYATSTSIPNDYYLFSISTLGETTTVSTEDRFVDVKRSDEKGQAIIQDSLSHSIITVETLDKVTNQSIPSILVEYLSNGETYTIIGIDATGQYNPSVITGSFTSTSNSPESNYVLANYSTSNNKFQLQNDWTYITKFMSFVSTVSTLSDLAYLLSDMPTLEQHAIFYDELCMTGPQMANALGFVSGGGKIITNVLFPLSGKILSAYKLIASALVGFSQYKLTSSAKEFLLDQPGAYLIRFYKLPLPFTILLFDIKGMCTQEENLKPEQFMFDTRKNVVISSRKLLLGQPYEIRISGTFSYWDAQLWRVNGIASGTTETKPMYLQPGLSNCPVSDDGEYRFALPRYSGCQNCENTNLPSRYSKLRFSVDGIINFIHIDPKSTAFNKIDHSYVYYLIGKGKALMIKLDDSYYLDNCGELKIEIYPVNP